MMHRYLLATVVGGSVLLAAFGITQEARTQNYRPMTPQQRAEATRKFLGLGPAPDKDMAAKGAPLFQQNCSFCHGPAARSRDSFKRSATSR